MKTCHEPEDSLYILYSLTLTYVRSPSKMHSSYTTFCFFCFLLPGALQPAMLGFIRCCALSQKLQKLQVVKSSLFYLLSFFFSTYLSVQLCIMHTEETVFWFKRRGALQRQVRVVSAVMVVICLSLTPPS